MGEEDPEVAVDEGELVDKYPVRVNLITSDCLFGSSCSLLRMIVLMNGILVHLI